MAGKPISATLGPAVRIANPEWRGPVSPGHNSVVRGSGAGNEIGDLDDPAGVPGSEAVQGAVLPAGLCLDLGKAVAVAVG